MLPNLFRIEGVHTEHHSGKILTLSKGGFGAFAVGQPGLAKAADALIRVYLDRDKAAKALVTQIAFNTCDFHAAFLLKIFVMVLYPCLFHCVLGGVLHCPRANLSPGSSGTLKRPFTGWRSTVQSSRL